MSAYDALAASYDGLMADGAYRRRAAFLARRLRKSPIPVETVLDLGCGTGTIACLLAKKGYQVLAADGRPRRRAWSARPCSSTRPCPGSAWPSRRTRWSPLWIP